MPRLPFYAFYVADYRADTRHLTPMQHFAYREILDEIFLSGQHRFPPSIPDDDKFLRLLCKPNSDEEWRETRDALIDGPRAPLRSENGRITQKRMTIEVKKALVRAEKSLNANRARWGLPDHPEGSDRASTVKSGPISGNGNGHEHMSKRQFVLIASKIREWTREKQGLLVGAHPEEWEEAFRREFGFSSAFWEAEKTFQNGPKT